jgi:hypothetical protein
MIDTLLLHPRTRRELVAITRDPSHALLLAGDLGSGKGTVARALAASYLDGRSHGALLGSAYFKEILPGNNSIGIDAIRELRKFLMLKTTGSGEIRRVAIIEDAQAMTLEAQNAFLKMLEEPPADTVIIVTADHPQHLLSTVNSRVQLVRVLPPEKTDVSAHFGGRYNAPDIERAYALSGGSVGLLTAILENNTSHTLVTQVQEAKELFGRTTFERLAMVDSLSKQKEHLPGLLTAFKRITKAALQQATAKGQHETAEKWHKRLNAIYEAEHAVLRSANAKLVLTNLFLHL